MPHLLKNATVDSDVNSDPPSLKICSGTPNVANKDRKACCNPCEPARLVWLGEENISTQPDSDDPENQKNQQKFAGRVSKEV